MKEIREKVIKEFRRRKYAESTIRGYSSTLFRLFDFYSAHNPTEITNKQVTSYASSLINQKKSHTTLRTLVFVCKIFFDQMHDKKHGIYKFKFPETPERSADFFEQSDILELIDRKENLKHKIIFLLMYSCGLEANELLEIQVKDIISKVENPFIILHDSKGNEKRRAYLSKRVIPLLSDYYKEFKPESYFIYGQNDKTKKYSYTSVSKLLKASVKEMELNPALTTRAFKYSYIKHLNQLGIPLTIVLENLKIKEFNSHFQYSKLIHEEQIINFTPYDKLITTTEKTESFDELESLVFKLKDLDEMDYLMEGIDCFRNGSLRAGVIFIWSSAIKNIRKQILDIDTLKNINIELIKIDSRAKKIKNIDSFEYIKDETTIHLAEKIGVFSKFEKNELINNCLGLRNKCGHPSNYKPEIQRVKSFVEEVLNMIYKKTLPNTV
jgi:site-specific recombinase XerD